MRTASSFIREQDDGIYLSIRLQPRAQRNEIVRALGNELKVKVNAPPVDNAANQALVEFLAEKLGCSRAAVQIVRGHTARHKTVRVQGISALAALAKLV